MPKMKMTKSSVEAIPNTESGQLIIRDTELIGFGVCVGIRAKSYFAQRESRGRTIRVKIGSHQLMTVEEARREARQVLAKIERGEFVGRNPKNAVHTLSDALESYLKERKGLRASTVDTYRRVVRLYLPDWSRFPLEHITRDMIVTKHAQIGDLRGHAVANTAMRVFRAIYNYAAAVNEALPPNPTVRLSQTRSWYPERRRRGWVRPHQLRPWYEGVLECDDGNLRDFLTLLLFTGLRRSEAIGLRWKYVDLIDRTLTVPDSREA